MWREGRLLSPWRDPLTKLGSWLASFYFRQYLKHSSYIYLYNRHFTVGLGSDQGYLHTVHMYVCTY